MRKLLVFIFGVLLIPVIVYAANLTDQTEDTSPTSDDLIYTVNDPGGTPADRKVTLGNAAKAMSSTNLTDTADIIYETELDTFSELDTQIADQTMVHSGSNIATATALAANGANCSAGNAPLGVDASGAVESCTDFEEDLSNEAGLETAVGGANVIVSTEIDTFSELDTIVADQTLVHSGSNIATATALAANGSNCSAGSAPLGVDASGAAESCTDYEEDLANEAGLETAVGGANVIVSTEIDAFSELDTLVADKELVNADDGEVWSGVHDFGGATSFEIPNSGAPTVNAVGELALDDGIVGHNGMIIYYDGTTDMTAIAIPTADLTTTDNHIIKYDAGSNKFTMEADAGGGSGAFDDSGDPIVQNTTTKDVHMGDGAGTLTGKVEIGGDADQPQLVIEGFSTQTDDILIIQNDADSEVFSVSNTGAFTNIEGALTNDTILEADLKAVDAASDEECLTYESTTGDFEWQSCGGGTATQVWDLQPQSAKIAGARIIWDATNGATINGGGGAFTLLFDAVNDEAGVWVTSLPNYWSSHSKLIVEYTAVSATSGTVEFEGAVDCKSDGDATETVDFSTIAVASVTVPGTAGQRDTATITLNDDSPTCAAEDTMYIYLSTDSDDGTNDSATGDRSVVSVKYEFNK